MAPDDAGVDGAGDGGRDSGAYATYSASVPSAAAGCASTQRCAAASASPEYGKGATTPTGAADSVGVGLGPVWAAATAPYVAAAARVKAAAGTMIREARISTDTPLRRS